MVDNKITRQRIKNHFTYSAWKYLMLAVVCVVAWDLIYSMTEYHPPRERRVHIYVLAGGADNEQLYNGMAQNILDTLEETEEVQFYSIAVTPNATDYSAEMQLSTYMAAQEGDVYLSPSYKFAVLSGGENGLFMPLDDYIASGVIDVSGMDLQSATARDEEGVEHVYGIPADNLYGLLKYNVDPAQMYLSIPLYSLNADNAARAIGTMVKMLTTPKPDWYEGFKKNQMDGNTPKSLIYEHE